MDITNLIIGLVLIIFGIYRTYMVYKTGRALWPFKDTDKNIKIGAYMDNFLVGLIGVLFIYNSIAQKENFELEEGDEWE